MNENEERFSQDEKNENGAVADGNASCENGDGSKYEAVDNKEVTDADNVKEVTDTDAADNIKETIGTDATDDGGWTDSREMSSDAEREKTVEGMRSAFASGVYPPPIVGRILKRVLAVCLCAVFGFFGAAVGIYALSRTSLVDENSMLSSWIIEASGLYVNRVETDIVADDISDGNTAVAEELIKYTVEIAELKEEEDGTYSRSGSASGVILSADGYIVTNQHVTEEVSALLVKLWNGEEYYVYRDAEKGEGRFVGEDSVTDLALVKIEPKSELPHAVPNVADVRYAQRVYAVGNPLGIGTSVTVGYISCPRRDVTSSGITNSMIQMDASVSPGNSGGGLFDVSGRLVGIVCAKSKGDGVEGIGYAIPMSTMMSTLDDLARYGHVKGRPMIGVTVLAVNSQSAYSSAANGDLKGYLFDYRYGVYVIECTNETADLRLGDRIIKFNGKKIENRNDLNAALFECAPGDAVTVVVERLVENGEDSGDEKKIEEVEVKLTLMERDT